MLVQRHAAAGLKADEGRRGAVSSFVIDPMDVHTRANWLPTQFLRVFRESNEILEDDGPRRSNVLDVGRPRFPVGFTWHRYIARCFISLGKRLPSMNGSRAQFREPAATIVSHREGTRWPGSLASRSPF